jgi:AraC-like DNA-binding protein
LQDFPALTHCGEGVPLFGATLLPHAHPGFEFLYLARGPKAHWRLGSDSVEQEKDDVIVVYPEESHWLLEPFEDETFRMWVGLDLKALGPTGVELARFLVEKRVRRLPRFTSLEPVMHAIASAAVTPLPDATMVLRAYVEIVLILVRQQLKIMANAGTLRARTHLPYSAAVQKAIFHMSRHLDSRLSLSELVKASGQHNRSHFCYSFRQEVGISPGAYHLQLRLDAAHAALAQPMAEITDVALQHGFGSSQHFSTAFRRAYGVTPLARKKTRAGVKS